MQGPSYGFQMMGENSVCLQFLIFPITQSSCFRFSKTKILLKALEDRQNLRTVELGFKNHQDKNLLDFKNQITYYQLVIDVVNYSQYKNILDFKNQNGSAQRQLPSNGTDRNGTFPNGTILKRPVCHFLN